MRSLSFVICAVVLRFDGTDASGKAGKSSRGLRRKQCDAFESKIAKKRPGWFCAADAKSCDALRACEPGGPGRTEAGRIHSG